LIFKTRGVVWVGLLLGSAALITAALANLTGAADLSIPIVVKAPEAATAAYDWSGFYIGADVGYASGHSNGLATTPGGPNANVSLDFFHTFDAFDGSGSHFGGLHAGYNYVLPSRLLFGVDADVSFPSTLRGGQDLSSAFVGAANYNDAIEMFGTVRGRVGYDTGRWLYYVTGGLAWTYDQFTRTQLADGPTGSTPSGTIETSFLGRIGWTVGAGVEVPIASGWTARLEYLHSQYGKLQRDVSAWRATVRLRFVSARGPLGRELQARH
jgi:high affinity Mn2+ porin